MCEVDHHHHDCALLVLTFDAVISNDSAIRMPTLQSASRPSPVCLRHLSTMGRSADSCEVAFKTGKERRIPETEGASIQTPRSREFEQFSFHPRGIHTQHAPTTILAQTEDAGFPQFRSARRLAKFLARGVQTRDAPTTIG
jgi:hypothetical protein